MKRVFLLGVILIVLGCRATSQTAPKQVKDPRKVISPPLREFHLPRAKRFVLENGMKVFLLEDHRLPLIDALLWVKAGSIYDPKGKEGLAELVATVMRSGGSLTKSGDQIDQELESIGALIEISAHREYTSAYLSCLKGDIDKCLGILFDILHNPCFPKDKIDLAKIQKKTQIRRRYDTAWSIAKHEFRKLIYGKDSPYARTAEIESIDAILQEDLAVFHKRYFYPNGMIIGMWGDFKTEDMKRKLEVLFGKWKRSKIEYPKIAPINQPKIPPVNYIEKKEFTQSTLVLGHLGIKRDHPDFPTLVLANHILGGSGFISRLWKNIRSTKGLAYAIWSSEGGEWGYPGRFYMACSTKLESTAEAISSLIQELKDLREKLVSEEELRVAKEYLINSFIFQFEKKSQIVERQMRYEFYGYPEDFAERCISQVKNATPDDIRKAVRRNFHPEKLIIFVVGNKEKFDRPLSTFGKVRKISLEKSPPMPEIKPDPESIKKAREIISRAISSFGGIEKINAVKDRIEISEITRQTPLGRLEIRMQTTTLYPDKMRIDVDTQKGRVSMILSGDRGWQRVGEISELLAVSQVKELKAGLVNDTINILKFLSKGDSQVQFLPQEKVEGKLANVIIMLDKHHRGTRRYFDEKSYLLIKKIFYVGDRVLEYIYSDHRDVDGIKLPYHVKILQKGRPAEVYRVREIRLNSGVKEEFFRP